MEFKQKNSLKDIGSQNKNISCRENIDKQNYLYPNGHRITHQMRWLKASRYRCLKIEMAA